MVSGHLVVVYDYPIKGVPSYRAYGPYKTFQEAMLEAVTLKEQFPHLTTFTAPLRDPSEIAKEA